MSAIATDLGKSIRLARLFDHRSGTSFILPVDHGIEGDHVELEKPAAAVRTFVDAGVNALLMRRGFARAAVTEFGGRAGWVQRITARTGLNPEAPEDFLAASVEQAVRSGADAVCGTFFLGGPDEEKRIADYGRISDQCAASGLPFVAEVFPVGGPESKVYVGPYTIADMRITVRAAAEEGADIIKTWYSGDPASFAKIVSYSPVPIIIAGGPKAPNELEVLRFIHAAMSAGARGLAVGRKIWQSPNPQAMIRAVAMILREGATAEQAHARFIQSRSN